MTRDEGLAFITRHLENYKRRDPVALAGDHAEDALVLSPIFATVQGRRAIEASYKSLFTAFPDWEMTGDDPIIDGNRIAQLFHITATHMSEIFGLPGTGKRFQFTCMMVWRIEDGLIAHERRVYDFARVMMDIGVLKGKLGR